MPGDKPDEDFLTTRQEAKASGEDKYFTGTPCKRGHVSPRWTSTAACIKCADENRIIRKKQHNSDKQAEQPATSLLFGPYAVPSVRPGDWLFDERYGLTEVGGYTTNRIIHWPRAKKGGAAQLILCGDLVRAVRNEAVVAVAHNWGVSEATVWYWRKALKVEQINPGTLQLYKQLSSIKLPEDIAARGREHARSAASIAKMSATKRGKPMHSSTREALLKSSTLPKPAGWGAQANQWMLAGKRKKAK